MAVTEHVPAAVTVNVLPEIVQPVAVPTDAIYVGVVPVVPPLVSSVSVAPKVPEVDETVKAVCVALPTVSVTADDVAVAVVPDRVLV